MNGAERGAAAVSTGAAVARVNRAVAEVGGVVRGRVRAGLSPLGPLGRLPMDVVDTQHTAVHSIVGATSVLVGRAAGHALSHGADPDATSLFDSPGATGTVGATQAAFGDVLPQPLNPPMRLVEVCPAPHREAPLVVFVHGLGGHDGQFAQSYLDSFSTAGFEVLSARYSTGRPIAENGRHLVSAVGGVARAPSRIVLVGHSMGGLVISEAVAMAPTWLSDVDTVVTLGSPFRGAPLERFARSTLGIAQRSRLMAPIIALGDHRSAGIKDLGDGTRTAIPGTVRHIAIVGMLGGSRRDVRSLALGDGMVPLSSAVGRAGHTEVVELTATGHLGLLRHERVPVLLAEVARSTADPTAR